jgi:hypothetical protein
MYNPRPIAASGNIRELCTADLMTKEEVLLSEPVCRVSLRAFMTVVFSVLAFWFSASTWAQQDKPPRYEVDATWPKPLPNNWLIGQVGGLAVDKHDHIWINQRPRSLTDDEKGAIPNPPTRTEPRSICCKPAPSVMEFDAEGNLLQAWGGPADPGKCKAPTCIWPENEHGIFVDDDDHVWISGNGPKERMLLSSAAMARS